MKMNIYWLIPALVLMFSLGCSKDEKMTKEKVQRMIAEELKAGDSEDKIRCFFRQKDIPFDYDEYVNKYHGIIRVEEKPDYTAHAILIDIHVDEKRRFVRAEISDHYTYP